MKSTALTPLTIAAAIPARGVDYFQWDQIAGEQWEPARGTDAVYDGALGYPCLDLLYKGNPVQAYTQYRNFPHIGYANNGTQYRKIKWQLKFVIKINGVPATASTDFSLRPDLVITQNYAVFDPAVVYRTDITSYSGTVSGDDIHTGTNFSRPVVLDIEYIPFNRVDVFMTVPDTPRVLKASTDMSSEPALTEPLTPRIDSGSNVTNFTGILLLANRLTWE